MRTSWVSHTGDCQQPDWNTFPGLDPMVTTVLEWGHSMTDDQGADFPAPQLLQSQRL